MLLSELAPNAAPQQHIEVSYCSNYNGCNVKDLTTNEFLDYEDPRVQAVSDQVCEFAVDFCDEDGEFEGDINAVAQVAQNAVRQAFGPNTLFSFEEDSVSS